MKLVVILIMIQIFINLIKKISLEEEGIFTDFFLLFFGYIFNYSNLLDYCIKIQIRIYIKINIIIFEKLSQFLKIEKHIRYITNKLY
jgi:hypothetical protein